MRTAITFFNFEMSVRCPYCHTETDLEDYEANDDGVGTFQKKFSEWISNAPNGSEVDEELECWSCEKRFKTERIER